MLLNQPHEPSDFALPRTRSLGQGKAIIARKKIGNSNALLREKLASWPVKIEFVVEAIFLSWLNFYSPQRHWPVSRIINGQQQIATLDVDAIQHLTELASACSSLTLTTSSENNTIDFAVNFDGTLADEHSFTLALRIDLAAAKIILDYDIAAIDETSANLLIQHLTRLFEVAERATDFKHLDLLSDDEKEILIRRYNKTAQPLSLSSVTDLLSVQAAKQPQASALIYQNRITSFAELYKTSGLLSTQLQLANASQVVGIFLPRSDLTIAALLGVWRAGKCYLPLPIDFPTEQLAHMCVENNVEHIIVGDEIALPEALSWATEICIQQLNAREILTDKPLDMETVAAVMYTSGSTGMPKGVRHSMRSLLNRFGWWLATYPAQSDDIFSQRTAVSFIPSLWEMVSGIVTGKPLVIINDLDARSPESLVQLVQTHCITRLAILPSFLRLVLTQENIPALRGLRYLILAGEPVAAEQLRNILAQLPETIVINDYGCTEVNGILSCDSREPWEDYNCLPAGRPIANCQAFILNPAQQIVPAGVIGELYLAGAGVTEGYVGLPQLNREKFIELELGDGISRRLYRTHDRAKRFADGRIQILGRNDNVVKIRGIRIELEGVEHALLQLPEIAAAAAVCQKNSETGARLICYLVAAPGHSINPTELLQRLTSRLPDAMLPSRLFVVDGLPKTANGKLNRAALYQQANNSLETSAQSAHQKDNNKENAQENISVDTAKIPTISVDKIIDSILKNLAAVGGLTKAELDIDAEFRSMGIDSANAVVLMESLSKSLARKLPVTLIYECATPRALAKYLVQQQQTQTTSNQHNVRTQCGNIAVVGIACRMPQADNLEAFWQNLIKEKNCVSDIPAQRWDWKDVYSSDANAHGKTNSRWGGFINGIDEFDPLFFNISASEAKFMAPEQRILLQACWHAIENAGYAEHDFYGRAMGVFIGARPADYMERLQAAGITPDAFTLLGNDSAILAARIAYYMNLKGPVITVDTACSSSAVAIHMACESIRRGESEIALAGGVSLVTTASQYIVNTKAGMVSPDGSCKTFDQAANGFVQGEGCGVLVLKPLEQALADNDRIYAVIHASGINQDGKTNGITAPNGEAQTQLISSVYHASNINPQDIQYIETHGTGTKLGDPIEFNALNNVFAKSDWTINSCALGSVKTNIGHLIAAAGVAGFIKAAQALYHKKIPANLHYQKTNEHIDIVNSPFFVNANLREWNCENTRIAALSSFGFSGTNCHLVLREAPAFEHAEPVSEHEKKSGPVFIMLSAKDQDGLLRNSEALLQWLNKNPDANLADLAYSYARRLNRFKALLILTAQNYDELVVALAAVIADEKHARVFRNNQPQALINGRHFTDLAELLIAEFRAEKFDQDALDSLATLMIGGVDVDIKNIYANKPYSLLDLPNYKFEVNHYWIDGKRNELANNAGETPIGKLPAAQNVLAKLTRDQAGNQQWSFNFSCTKTEFAGHKIDEQIWWPAAAQLQCLQAAIAHISAGHQVQVKDWQFLNPLVLEAETNTIELRITETNKYFAQFEFIASEKCLSKGVLCIDAEHKFTTSKLDLANVAKQCRQLINPEDYYAAFARKGIDYGSDYRRIVQIRRGKNQALCWISLPSEHRLHAANYQVELFDAALHSLAALQTSTNTTQVPVAINQMLCLPPLPAEFGSYATIESKSDRHLTATLWLFDKTGNIFAWLAGMQLQNLVKNNVVALENISPANTAALETLLYSPRWFDEPLTASTALVNVRILGELQDEFTAPVRCLGRYTTSADLFQATNVFSENEVLVWKLSANEINQAENSCWDFIELTRQLMQLDAKPKKLLIACQHQETWSNHLLALTGAVQSFKKEYPNVAIKIVQALNAEPNWIAQEIADDYWQTEIHRIGIQRLIPLWNEYRAQQTLPKYKLPQVSLITGGLGGVGSELAKYLSRVAGSGLVLVGRRALDNTQREFINELRRDGAEVVYWQTDVSDALACERLIHKIIQRFGQLDGIYHCAGVTRDAFLINKTRAQVDEVMAAKVRSCENLDNASAHLELKNFVLFSSISAVLGTLGQIDYGTANAWLDNFARNRNQNTARSGHCLSINWPLWATQGMRPDVATETWLKDHMGMHAMPAEIAFTCMQQLLVDRLDQAMVLYGEPKKLMQFVSENTPLAAAQMAVGS